MAPRALATSTPFARRLRQLRQARGLTQAQLAAAAGLSLKQVQRHENGRAEPRLATALALAAGLGVAPGILIGTGGGKWRPILRN